MARSVSKLWLALVATLLVGGIHTASAQMHGSARGDGRHDGHFHDGRFSHEARFHHPHVNSGAFVGAPVFWWGAPSYPYDYLPYSAASFVIPPYAGSGPATYILNDASTLPGGSKVWRWCSDSSSLYGRGQQCANDLVLVVPDDHAPAVTLSSKERPNAELFAKAKGCQSPVAKMTLAVSGSDSFETFAVACEGERSMFVRCDSGQCRAML